MPEGQVETGTEGGSGLRAQLEEALRRNRELEAEATSAKAANLIQQHGLKFVKPEDLKGVPLTELETKAQELNTAKAAERAEVLKDVLRANGVADDQLDGAVAALVGGQSAEGAAQTEVLHLLSQVTKVPGTPAPRVETKDLVGQDRILAELEKKSDKATKRR